MRQLNRFARIFQSHIDGVLFGLPDEHRIGRLVWASATGFGLACAFWVFVLSSLGIPAWCENYVYLWLLLFLGIGYPTSVHIRCTCILVCVGFFGKAGRSYMKAILFGLIIAGPVYNITINCKEVVRVFECSAGLTYNLTKTRYDLLTSPFRHSLHQLPKNVSYINRSFEKVIFIVRPIREEVLESDRKSNTTVTAAHRSLRQDNMHFDSERMDEKEAKAQQIHSNYMNKIRNRCQVQIDRGHDRCKQAFAKAYERCMEKLPIVLDVMLCWPMKLTIVCKAVLPSGKDICDPKDHVNASMGADFVELEQTIDLMGPAHVNASAEGGKSTFSRIEKKSKETSTQVLHDLNKKWHLVSVYMYILRKIMAWTFLKVVKNAIAYERKYLNDIDFDNVFISNYFQRVDARRLVNARRTLLPMKKIEKSKMLRILDCKRSRQEFWSTMTQLCKTTLEMLTAACFLLLDHLLAVGMQIVADHAQIEFRQEGEHVVDIQVNGTGIIAQLVRKSVSSANIDLQVKLVMDNAKCLPQPTHLATGEYVHILTMYVLMLLLIFIETYLQRLRHCIAAYFYFKREKQRILYAYNLGLKKRRGLLRQTLLQVEEQLRYDGQGGIWYGGICHRVPMCWWLRWLPACRRQCIICTDPEPFRMDHRAVKECMLCRTIYCAECWTEIGAVCVVCRYLRRKLSGGGDDDDMYYDWDWESAGHSSDSSDSDV